MRKRLYLVLLGLLSVWLGVAAQTGTDTRTEVTSVTATSNISELIGDGKSVTKPTITVSDGSVAYIRVYDRWEKKNAAGEWETYTGSTFTAGTYRLRSQLRIDGSYATTHKLAENVSLTVDGKAWKVGTPYVGPDKSYVGVASPEIVVEKDEDPREKVKSVTATSDIADIIKYGAEVKLPTITMSEGSVANVPESNISLWKKIASNKWRRFSETTFTEGTYRVRIQVCVDSTTHRLADEWTLTVDGKEWTAGQPAVEDGYSSALASSPEIVVEKDEDPREEVKSVTATSNIADIIKYGAEVKLPTFTLSEGSVARISQDDISWWKQDAAGEWQRFEESTFTEGVYKARVRVRVDGSYGTTHKLADEWTLTVDGKEWTTYHTFVSDEYSSALATSPEIVVENPVGIESAKSTSDAPANIYNLQGILVKRNATADNLRSLPAGIYIMNGRKVIVK